jgi:protease II
MEAIKEFGDFSNKEAYRQMLSMSPYHMPIDPAQARPITDLLICCEEGPMTYHSRKLIARLRDEFAQEPLRAFYREFAQKMYTSE